MDGSASHLEPTLYHSTSDWFQLLEVYYQPFFFFSRGYFCMVEEARMRSCMRRMVER